MKNKPSFSSLFKQNPIIGMVHLRALPGSPSYENSIQKVIDTALQDAHILAEGGVDGIMVENFFDAPFFKDAVGPETVAAMTRVITLIHRQTDLPLGVNVLRNDGMSAMAIATACECQFIRVNVVSWAMLTDQGAIEGQAARLARFRRLLDSDVLLFADCLVKHAVPMAPQSMELVALDTWERGGADALIISGTATGRATDEVDILAARKGAPEAPILLGSGVNANNIGSYLSITDGVITGTSLKKDGKVENAIELSRVRALVKARYGYQ